MTHIRHLLRFVRPYWRRSLVALALLSAVVVMDLAIPRLIERIIDHGITPHDQTVVVNTALLMLGISGLHGFAVGNNYLRRSAERRLRPALSAVPHDPGVLLRDPIAGPPAAACLTSDTTISAVTQITCDRHPAPLFIGSLILMVNTSRSLALTMLPLLLITSAIIVLFIRQTEPLFRLAQQKLDRLNTVLQENIAGVRVVKAFVRADFEAEKFEAANEDYAANSIRVMQFMTNMVPALTVFVNLGMVVVIWAGGLQAIRGGLTLGQIVAFTNYLLTTMTPLILMTLLSNVWAGGIASARRVDEILQAVPEVQDLPEAPSLPEGARGRLVFENVSFHYNDNHAEAVLRGVDLAVQPGETIAILGATGAGKSTLVNLVPRFYDASAGRILIDGIDLRHVRQDSLLALVGVVPQETILFSGTVRDNIRYGAPRSSEAEVVAAATAAQAHDFILKMPQGYDSLVEARGANLSGGQKQRLAIARALLTRPRILILDDSTSSVDVETETRIQDALAAQPFPHTSLVVAQRISTVLRADKIVVLDKGRIAAVGTHRELIQSSSIYREIYDSQLGEGIRLEEPS
jgi:ATP-binding cassette subfamily B protein